MPQMCLPALLTDERHNLPSRDRQSDPAERLTILAVGEMDVVQLKHIVAFRRKIPDDKLGVQRSDGWQPLISHAQIEDLLLDGKVCNEAVHPEEVARQASEPVTELLDDLPYHGQLAQADLPCAYHEQ